MQQNRIQNLNLTKVLFISLIAIMMCSLPVIAQNHLNTISGKVMYNNKAIVDDAIVSILDAKDNSVVVSGITALDGTFSFDQLQSGKYMISVQVYGQPGKLYGPVIIEEKAKHTVMEPFYLNISKEKSDIIIKTTRLK